jgi:hypothetical protein
MLVASLRSLLGYAVLNLSLGSRAVSFLGKIEMWKF